jgi:hypothetical protein
MQPLLPLVLSSTLTSSASANIDGTKITAGTTSVRGTLQLTNSTTSTSTTTAATPANVRTAVNNAASAQTTANAALPKAGGTMTGDVTFTTAQPRVASAWVNFNGAFGTSPFTIANGGIRAAFNVSSVTDLGTGSYRVNFTTAMPDANYAVTASAGSSWGWVIVDTYATGSVKARTFGELSGSFPPENESIVCIAVFR